MFFNLLKNSVNIEKISLNSVELHIWGLRNVCDDLLGGPIETASCELSHTRHKKTFISRCTRICCARPKMPDNTLYSLFIHDNETLYKPLWKCKGVLKEDILYSLLLLINEIDDISIIETFYFSVSRSFFIYYLFKKFLWPLYIKKLSFIYSI